MISNISHSSTSQFRFLLPTMKGPGKELPHTTPAYQDSWISKRMDSYRKRLLSKKEQFEYVSLVPVADPHSCLFSTNLWNLALLKNFKLHLVDTCNSAEDPSRKFCDTFIFPSRKVSLKSPLFLYPAHDSFLNFINFTFEADKNALTSAVSSLLVNWSWIQIVDPAIQDCSAIWLQEARRYDDRL